MEKIERKLEEIIKRVFGITTKAEVTLAPEEFNADFSSNVAMKITGEVNKILEKKMNSREVAEVLKREFLETLGDEFPEFAVEVAGPGFLNFTPGDGFYFQFIESFGENLENFEKKISPDEYRGKTVVTEFSDPNPFKVLHVGHLYTSIVGDAISRLIETAGGKVVRVNFGGDVGLHVAKTLFILLKNKINNFTIEDIAKAYVEGTRAYEDDAEAKKKIVQFNKLIYKIAEKGEGNFEGLNEEEREIAEIYFKGRELSYKYFKDFYREIGVRFDKFYPESAVAGTGLNKILEQKEKGVYSESDGAVVFRGEDYGLHTRVFVNKEGLPTYEAKDVGLLFTKWADYKFDESVVITGNDIIDYMKVVLKSVEQYAPELVERTRHITHGNVRLPGNEKMSSRKGNFVTAESVLTLVKSTLAASSASADALLAQRMSNTSRSATPASLNKLATDDFEAQSEFNKIALGAIKYFFLKYKIGGNIVFNAEESVALNGNSGVYLLYSTVRAKKILGKLQRNNSLALDGSSQETAFSRPVVTGESRLVLPRSGPDVPEEKRVEPRVNTCDGMNSFERKLNKKFVQYPEVLRGAVREKAPHLVANYLFELAQEFSRFYENCPVAGSDSEAERKKFVQVFIKIMEHGLTILGIKVPESM